jgi:hypothetical protein
MSKVDGPAAAAESPTTSATPEMRLQVTLERHRATRTEIQWRGVQRDAMVIFAFTLMGVVFGGIDQIGAWILLAPFPLAYLASMWLQHDRRIGSLAHYLRNILEPAMEQYDNLTGLEKHLDEFEGARAYSQRFHFSSVMSRLLFPSLQGMALGTGIGLFIHAGPYKPSVIVLVTVAALIILGSTILTFAKVKHIRIK